jgi:nicotinamide-nucleotide amidase
MVDSSKRWCSLGLVLLATALATARAAGDDPPDTPDRTVDYVLVVTGGELLAGAYADVHTSFLTRTLRPLGFRCRAVLIVDDVAEELQQAVRSGLARANLVIVTGGLGPTPDDVTRDALSELTGIPIREHPELIANLERRFGAPREQIRANLRRQTEVPVRGGYLLNPNGTAAGLMFDDGDRLIVALPGPPRELQPMVREVLVPRLTERYGTRAAGHLLMLRFVGIGESQIAETIAQQVLIPEGVTVASLFEGMRVDFYFTRSGASPDDQACLEQVREQVQRHLGEYIYAADATTLEEHVVDLLAARGLTIALAEVGSGGSLVAALGSSTAISKVLLGAYVAPDEERLWKMLGSAATTADSPDSPNPAAVIVQQLAQQSGADMVVATVSAQAEEGGNRFVEVAFRHEGQVTAQRLPLRGTGELARFHLTTQLLDMIRRRLQAGN